MIRYRAFRTLGGDERLLLLRGMDTPIHLRLLEQEAYGTTADMLQHPSDELRNARRETFLWLRELAASPHLRLHAEFERVLERYYGSVDRPLIQGYEQET
jgi:hypothetical protein